MGPALEKETVEVGDYIIEATSKERLDIHTNVFEEGHEEEVCKVLYFEKYEKIVSCSMDATLRFWIVSNFSCEESITIGSSCTGILKWNEDILVCCGTAMEVGVIISFEIETNKKEKVVLEHELSFFNIFKLADMKIDGSNEDVICCLTIFDTVLLVSYSKEIVLKEIIFSCRVPIVRISFLHESRIYLYSTKGGGKYSLKLFNLENECIEREYSIRGDDESYQHGGIYDATIYIDQDENHEMIVLGGSGKILHFFDSSKPISTFNVVLKHDILCCSTYFDSYIFVGGLKFGNFSLIELDKVNNHNRVFSGVIHLNGITDIYPFISVTNELMCIIGSKNAEIRMIKIKNFIRNKIWRKDIEERVNFLRDEYFQIVPKNGVIRISWNGKKSSCSLFVSLLV